MDFIERLRAKPDHVRQRIVFLTASGATGLIALMWVTAFTSSGALSRSVEVKENPIASAFSDNEGASLLGAIGALTTTEEGSIQVVGTSASSTAPAQTSDNRTTIPF